MEIKFDVYFKKNLGTLFKSNEVDLDGITAHTNLDLNLVDRLDINYKVGGKKYTDAVEVINVEEKTIQIPFKSDVLKIGINEFEIVAYMKNGNIKASQTYMYNIQEAIGGGEYPEGGSGGNGDVATISHSHANLLVLNIITAEKIEEWNNKADRKHTHNASDIEGLGDIDLDIDLSNYYNKSEVDTKIAEAALGGEVDLSVYATKNYVTDEISKIELKEGPKGDKGEQGEQGPQGDKGITPNITIGNVTTLEPSQQATVTRRGTDTNPIFDFAIPRGIKGDKGDSGSGGSGGSEKEWELIRKITLENDVSSVEVSSNSEGKSFSYEEIFFYLEGKSRGVSANIGIALNDTLICYSASYSNSNNTSVLNWFAGCKNIDGFIIAECKPLFNATYGGTSTQDIKKTTIENINKIKIYGTNSTDVGWQKDTVFWFYGR